MKKAIYALIVIFLLISSIFLLFQNQKLKKEINALDIKIADMEKQTKEAKNRLLVGWKEYVNDKYKFKVWYPEKITDKFYGTANVGMNEYDSVSEKSHIIFFAIPGDGSPANIIYIYIYNTDLDIKEFINDNIKKFRPNMEKYSDAEIIAGIQQVKSGNLDLYKFRDDGDYYLKKDDLIFAFIPGDSGPANYQQMYETMVQSFRFIE